MIFGWEQREKNNKIRRNSSRSNILTLLKVHPGKNFLKTSSVRLQRNNFTSSKTSWSHLVRRLEDVLEDEKLNSSRHVLKTSWRHVLRVSWKHALKTSWKHYGDKQNLLGTSASIKSKCVSKKSIFHKSIFDNSKANPKCIN